MNDIRGNAIIAELKCEIKWCKEHLPKKTDKTYKWKIGFIKGLKQAITVIRLNQTQTRY